MESTQSITVQFYYKGFSILLTKRDPEIEVKPLLINAMASIDWAINNDLQPSWNAETNKEALKDNEVKKSVPVEQFEDVCENCGSKKGTSKKGNRYCLAKCWLK